MKISLAFVLPLIMYLNLSVYDYKLLNFALVKSVVHYDIILSHLPNSLSFYVRAWPFILN